MNRTIRWIVVGALLVALVIVLLTSNSSRFKKETPPLMPDSTVLDISIPVSGTVVDYADFEHILSVTGVMTARHRSMLSSETGGRVMRWLAEVGQSLDEGEAILELDSELAGLNLRQAEAQLVSAQTACEKQRRDMVKFQRLLDEGNMSHNDFEAAELGLHNAEAGLAGAEAAVGMAKRTFRETTVRMPYNGVLASKMVEVAQNIAPGTPVGEVVQCNPICLNVGVSEDDIVQLRKGMNVRVQTTGWKDRFFDGKVHAVGVAAGLANRLFPVEIRLKNHDRELLAGMSAHAEIVVRKYTNVVSIPRDVITTDLNRSYVFIADAGRAKKIEVTIDQMSGGNALISGGLNVGNTLIVIGFGSLKNDQKIELSLDK